MVVVPLFVLSSGHRARLVCVISAVLTCGCDLLAPPEDGDTQVPEPGWVKSRPFPNIRSLNDVAVLAPERAYAVGTDGAVLRWAGEAWVTEETATAEDLECVDALRLDADGADDDAAARELVLAAGANGAVLLKVDGTWAALSSPVTTHLFGCALVAADDGFIVGDDGTLLRLRLDVDAPAPLETVEIVALVDQTRLPNDAADENGDPIACTGPADCDGGTTCDASRGVCTTFLPVPEPLKGVSARGDTLFIVGGRGAIYRFDVSRPRNDATNRVIREASGTVRTLPSVFAEAGVWVPTTDGVVMVRNGANDWDDDTFRVPVPVFLQDVWTRGGGDVFAVGLAEDIYHFDGAWSLTRVGESAQLRAVDGVEVAPPDGPEEPEEQEEPTREVFVVGGGGIIVRGPLTLPLDGEEVLSTRAEPP